MRKIVFRGHADAVGTDYAQLEEIDEPITVEELDEWAREIGTDWADSYGCESEEELEDCDWWWEEYNPEEHDGIIT